MEKVNELIKSIEKITKLEDVEFVEFDDDAYYFIGYNYDEGKEVEIELKIFNDVLANKNIWLIKK